MSTDAASQRPVAPENTCAESGIDLHLLAELVADRVVARLTETRLPTAGLVDPATLADELGVSRSYIYANAESLGAVRLGDGPRARLRFDLDAARDRFVCCQSRGSEAPDSQAPPSDPAGPVRRGRRRLPNRLPEPGSILTVRGRDAAQ